MFACSGGRCARASRAGKGETTPTGGRHKGAAMYCNVWLCYARTSAGTCNLFDTICSLLLLERVSPSFSSFYMAPGACRTRRNQISRSYVNANDSQIACIFFYRKCSLSQNRSKLCSRAGRGRRPIDPILARKVSVRSLCMQIYQEIFEGPEELWRLSWCEQTHDHPFDGYVNGSQSL